MNILFFVSFVSSHSWLDCIGSPDAQYNGEAQYFHDGDFQNICSGYPRSYPGRMDRDINTKFTYFVSGRNKSSPICHASQMQATYSTKHKMGTVQMEENQPKRLKLWWEMDNHPKPETKVSIFGTKKPETQINTYGELNNDNLIQTMVFASKDNCFDLSKPNTLCWGYMDIPQNIEPGIYSFVWMWHWNFNPVGEEFTTCFDLEIN